MKTQRTQKIRHSTMIGTILILLVPLVAMWFSEEWDWGLADFIIIGSLLIGTGFGYERATRHVASADRRLIIGMAFLLAMLLIWVQMAVGIFGD